MRQKYLAARLICPTICCDGIDQILRCIERTPGQPAVNLKQLEHFVAVAEEQHFTRAAKRVNIIQSGLSASIRALEEELGAPLFVRTTRRVEMTTAGQVLYERAQQILDSVKEARLAVAAVNGLAKGRLSIGTCASLNAFLDLPLLLGEFHALYPAIEIKLCHNTATSLMTKVRDGAVDVAFLPLFEKPRDVVTTSIAVDRLVIACPAAHALAGRKNVKLKSLPDEPFVDFQLEQGTRRMVDRAFSELGLTRRTALEVGDVQVLLDLVARGLGIALVPETFARNRAAVSEGPNIGIATLAQPGIRWELVAAFAGLSGATHSKNPATAAFADVLARNRCPAKSA
jgi:DNA-binding transcriptional LysR family regulator